MTKLQTKLSWLHFLWLTVYNFPHQHRYDPALHSEVALSCAGELWLLCEQETVETALVIIIFLSVILLLVPKPAILLWKNKIFLVRMADKNKNICHVLHSCSET